MKQFRIVVLLIMASTALWSCKSTGHLYIEFVNKSDKVVRFQSLINWPGGTTFNCPANGGKMILKSVRPDSTYRIESGLLSYGWEAELGNDKLHILVAEGEAYKQYWKEPCDTIRKYVPILHHYRLTVEDLEQMNWKVVYPPQE